MIDKHRARRPKNKEVKGLLSDMVSLGRPVCDICRDMSPDEREACDGEFWPTWMVKYVNVNRDAVQNILLESVCQYHCLTESPPEGATHMGVCYPTLREDDDRWKSSYDVNPVKVWSIRNTSEDENT